jgi:hypothetical protein
MPEPVHPPAHQRPGGKPFPWRCPRCGQKEVRAAIIPYRCQRQHDGQLLTVEIPNLSVPRCDNCGELVFDYAADEQIAEAFHARLRGDGKAGEEAASPAPCADERRSAG